ncbi:MAG TPA: hypothetical protein VET85_01205 [Stellaceae bacterium]|nr:hypothetical protein [Stellaceae bacterium]
MVRRTSAFCAAAPLLLAASLLASGPAFAKDGDHDGDDGHHASRCHLGNGTKHVIYLQFDNVHLRRDNPNVPSDLEQMPNLLDFLTDNGTLFTNHHTPLISHTAVDIVTALTGVYGEKFGWAVGNSFGFFNSNGSVSFPSSFTYWTDKLSDGTFQMQDRHGNNAPAPWVPWTRAGCDVGAFSLANIEFENTHGDVDNVFGPTSTEHDEVAQADALPNTPANAAAKSKPVADFEGIAVHCAQGSPLCKNGAPDILTQEPGGYTGFSALYGNINVAPAINHGANCVNDLDGNPVADSHGNCGFPGFDPRPAQSLGYVAQMLEAGVPVVYFYIEDAHDNDSGLSGVPDSVAQTFGPGEQGYVTTLKAYDKAFGQFFARLKKDGITKENTLFVVTADENDHFVGSPASPAGCDGVTTPCTYAKKGEVDADLSLAYATEFGNTTPFRVHSDDAPTVYIIGDQNGQTDTPTRTLEQQAAQMLGFDTVANNGVGATNHVAQRLVDHAGQAFLHMIPFGANRVPNFILFGNDDYFLFATGHTSPLCSPASNAASCFVEESGFAWNHGDFQKQITHTWLGMVGPGIKQHGRFGEIFSDHSDIRPTMLSLAGLKDDYAHDGRALFEAIENQALPDSVQDSKNTLSELASAYKAINAPRGLLSDKILKLSTRALAASDAGDATYNRLEDRIRDITARRNAIAGQMIDILEDAVFDRKDVDREKAHDLIEAAEALTNTDFDHDDSF